MSSCQLIIAKLQLREKAILLELTQGPSCVVACNIACYTGRQIARQIAGND
jgi:hypothetical protein